MRRRDLLIIGGAVGVALAVPPVLRRLPSEFEFSPLDGFAGFRRLDMGGVTGGGDPFAGLRLPDQAPLEETPISNLCSALFGPDAWAQDDVPIAIFNDFYCPYCRTLETDLLARADADASLRLSWRDMPLLGERSRQAARAALAARFAGKERAARAYLWDNGLRPGPSAVEQMAQALALDAGWLKREMTTRRVSEALAGSVNLGRRLGIPGTPGTFIGRTLVIGAMRAADLDKLIELERAEGPLDCAA